jgi:hypothetical protein
MNSSPSQATCSVLRPGVKNSRPARGPCGVRKVGSRCKSGISCSDQVVKGRSCSSPQESRGCPKGASAEGRARSDSCGCRFATLTPRPSDQSKRPSFRTTGRRLNGSEGRARRIERGTRPLRGLRVGGTRLEAPRENTALWQAVGRPVNAPVRRAAASSPRASWRRADWYQAIGREAETGRLEQEPLLVFAREAPALPAMVCRSDPRRPVHIHADVPLLRQKMPNSIQWRPSSVSGACRSSVTWSGSATSTGPYSRLKNQVSVGSPSSSGWDRSSASPPRAVA